MALIRKYNTGGSFADYVKERLAKGELPLTTKSWNPVQEALTTFDPNKSYEGEVKKNWVGQDVADNPELANIYLANLYKDYQQTSPRKINLTPEGGWGPNERSIGTLLEHITKKDYAGNEDYAIRQIARMTDNNQVKKYIVEKSRELADDYLSKASQNPTDSWANLEDIKTTRDILASINTDADISEEDWEKVSAFTDKLGWRVNDFLISDETLKQRKVDAENRQKEQERSNLVNYYNERGITDENIQNQLYQGGYTKPADQLHENIRKLLEQRGYSAFTNEAGNDYRIFKGNAFATEGMGLLTEDQFSNDYGKAFSIQNGQLIFHDRGQLPEGLELPEWADEGNLRRRLIPLSGTSLPGLYDYENSEWKGWRIFGDSNEKAGVPAKDILGRRDYTASITLISPDNKQTIKAFKEADDSYRTEDGRKLPKFTFSGFGESEEIVPLHSQSLYNSADYNHLGWGNIEANNPNDWWEWAFRRDKNAQTYKIDTNYLEEQLRKYESEIANATYQNRDLQNIKPEELKTLLKRAKWYYNHGTKEEREWATANFSRLNNILAKEDTQGNKLFKFEQGGILKAQDGSSLKAAVEANKKYARSSNSETGSTSEDKKGITGIDLKTAWKNASGLQQASTIASAVSMIPILGVAGGATSTVLDAIDGAQDGRFDKSDWLNLAGNLGFTALSAVGLGATKTGKLVMQANRMAKLGKTAKTAGKAGKAIKETSKAADIASDLTKAAERAKKWGANKNTVSILEDASKAVESGEKIGDDVLKLADDFLKPSTTWIGAHTEGIGDVVKTASKFVTEKAPLLGKAAKMGLIGQAGYTGALGATDLVGNMISEGSIREGFMNTDINSLRQTAQLASLGGNAYMNRKYSKAAKKYIKMEGATPDKTIVTVGDKKITVDGELLKKYNTSIKNTVKGPFKPSIKEADKKSFLEGLKGKVSKQDQGTIDALLEQKGKIGKIEFNPIKSSGGNPVLATEPESFSFGDRQQYKIAKNIYEQGNTRYGQFSREKQPIIYETSAAEAAAKQTAGAAKTAAKTVAKDVAKQTKEVAKKVAETVIKDTPKPVAKPTVNQEVSLAQLFKDSKTVRSAIERHRGSNVKTKNLGVLKNRNLPKNRNFPKKQYRNLSKKQQGGILKFQNSGIIPSINKGLSLPEWLKSPIKVTYNSLKDSNADKLRFTSPIVSKGMSDFATKFPTMSKIFNSHGQSYQGSQTPQTVQGAPGELLIDDYKVLPYEAKPYRNISPLLEYAKFAFVNKKNQENLALQMKAATQIPKLNTAERTHLRTSNVYSNIADRQANEVSGEGKRLASTIADIDKALNVRLGGAKQAAEIRATGAYKDIENNQAIMGRQMEIDANTNAYNRSAMDKQSALSAEAMKNVYAIQSMGKTMEANAGQNFLLAYGRNKESEPYRRAMWEYQQASMDPNLEHSYKYNNYLSTTAKEKARKAYDDFYANLEKTSPEYLSKPTFENSPMYKVWKDKYDAHQSILNGTMSRYNILGRALQNYIPSMQKGGRIPLSERIALENVKYNHKRLLKENELFYKQIMENNRLVQKALSKVFK